MNDEVDEEPRRGLDHADLAVGHGDESLVDELVVDRISRPSLHDVRLGLLVGQRNRRNLGKWKRVPEFWVSRNQRFVIAYGRLFAPIGLSVGWLVDNTFISSALSEPLLLNRTLLNTSAVHLDQAWQSLESGFL